MDTSISIKELYKLIDLYKYASVIGERVEVIVTPYFNDGKWDDSKRVITIGLQGGSSRDRDTFIVENDGTFDKGKIKECCTSIDTITSEISSVMGKITNKLINLENSINDYRVQYNNASSNYNSARLKEQGD